MAEPEEKKPSVGELEGEQLDSVVGGGGKQTPAESPKEEITFEYGGMQIQYTQQKTD
jgi:hypothetical protein